MNSSADNLSVLSSITTSDEKENVIEEFKPSTPEVPDPEYSSENLETLVTFIQKMTTLCTLDQNDWTDTCVSVIQQWLNDVSELILVVFYDPYTALLRACLKFPNESVHDLMYFLREPNQVFTVQGFHDEVTFGALDGDVCGSLLNVLERVYSPIFYRSDLWSETDVSMLYSSLYSFLGFSTILHSKMAGTTVLYVPFEGQEFKSDEIVRIRDLGNEIFVRYENLTIQWCSQIRECLNDQQRLVPYELLCPYDEYEFWVYRFEVLRGLSAQLHHPDFIHIENTLQKGQSIHLNQILDLKAKCQIKIKIAGSNMKYLELLVKPCQDLNKLENPAVLYKELPAIVQTFRFIWLNSDYYNSKELIATLFCNLSNQIIIFCSNKVNIEHVLEGNPRFGIKMCGMSIDCCLSYKAIYEIISNDRSNRNSEITWDLDEALIFSHIDEYINRLYDVIDICESMIVFGRMDEWECIQSPRFGGSRGLEFEKFFCGIEKNFLSTLEDIKGNSKTAILNVHQNRWHQDVVKYRQTIKDLEDTIESLISNVFASVCNVKEGIDGLCAIHFFSCRKSLREILLHKTSDVFNLFIREISATKKGILLEAAKRPASMPKFSSKVVALKVNLERIKYLKGLLDEAKWLLKVSESDQAMKDFDEMEANFLRNMKKIYTDWVQSLGYEFNSGLERPLMVRSSSTTCPGLLECNVDRKILDICEEARYFELLNFPIPVHVNQIYQKSKTLKLVYESVMTVVLDYNKILTSLSTEERKLFHALIFSCNKKIAPGFSKLTWAGELSDAYISDCVRYLTHLQGFVDLYKIANEAIAEICLRISDTSILQLPTTSAVMLHDLVQIMDKHNQYILEQFTGFYKNICELIAAVYKGFEPYMETMGKEWLEYMVRIDQVVQKGFCETARNSLQNILKVLNADESMLPSPIISLELDMVNMEIMCTPPMEDVIAVLSALHLKIVQSVDNFPLLCVHFKLPVEDGMKNFSEIISCDSICKKLQEDVNSTVLEVRKQLAHYFFTWTVFSYLWMLDKSVYKQKFEASNPSTENFDIFINKYKEIADHVSAQETITTICFLVVNSCNLKRNIISHVDEWQNLHTELLKKRANDKINDIYLYMQNNTALMLETPRTISDLQKTVELYEKLLIEVPEKCKEFPEILENFNILEKYEIYISSDLRQMAKNLQNEWSKYLEKLKEAHEMLENCRDEFETSSIQTGVYQLNTPTPSQ